MPQKRLAQSQIHHEAGERRFFRLNGNYKPSPLESLLGRRSFLVD
jgi:hypothetical protein